MGKTFYLRPLKNRLLGVRLTKEEHLQLFQLADERKVSVSELVRRLIYIELRKAGTPTTPNFKQVH